MSSQSKVNGGLPVDATQLLPASLPASLGGVALVRSNTGDGANALLGLGVTAHPPGTSVPVAEDAALAARFGMPPQPPPPYPEMMPPQPPPPYPEMS